MTRNQRLFFVTSNDRGLKKGQFEIAWIDDKKLVRILSFIIPHSNGIKIYPKLETHPSVGSWIPSLIFPVSREASNIWISQKIWVVIISYLYVIIHTYIYMYVYIYLYTQIIYSWGNTRGLGFWVTINTTKIPHDPFLEWRKNILGTPQSGNFSGWNEGLPTIQTKKRE